MSSLLLGFVAEPLVSGWLEAGLRHIGSPPDEVVRTVAFILTLGLVSFAHMVVGEMVPKNLTIAAPERTLLWLAIPNRIYVGLFGPIIRSLNALANAGVRLLGSDVRSDLDTTHSADEIADMLADSRHEGLIEPFEHELLTGALGLAEQPVSSVMVPWADVATTTRGSTVADLEQIIVERGHSRVPVVDDVTGRVLGFLHAKDLMTLPADAQDRSLPFGRLRRMLVLPPDRSLEDTLLTMQRGRLHMAVVVDAGRAVGLTTLEDVLEQLVGDIRDESDRDPVARR
jgi:CBS domain containing-hemolysin-like protein